MESNILPVEMMCEIALQSNYDTTLKLLNDYPQFDNDNFWKLKCQKQFPTKYYFEHLNSKENYLVQNKGEFLLPVPEMGFLEMNDDIISPLLENRHNIVFDNYLYEYSEILTEIWFVKNDRHYNLHSLTMQNRFVVVRCDDCYGESEIIGQYATELDAINFLKADQLSLNDKYKDDENIEIYYLIFDLEYYIPYLTTGKLKTSTLECNNQITCHKFTVGQQ